MAIQPVTCPQCQTAMRTQRPLSPTDMVRCPQCGNHFLGMATGTPAPGQDLAPSLLHTPASVKRQLGFAQLLIPAVVASFLLGVGAVTGTFLYLKSLGGPTPVVEDPRTRELAEKQKQLEEQEKDLEAQRANLKDAERRHQFMTFIDAGKKALGDKNYEDAEKSYANAMELYPNDLEASKGLAAAKAGKISVTVDTSIGQDQKKRKAAFDQFVEQGQQAMTAKKYTEAVIYYESALALMTGEEAVQGIANAKKELEKDKVEKDKLAAYQKFIAAGKAASDSGRYTDAIREYLGAQSLVPGDAVAVKGQQDAEKKIADAKNADDFKKLVDNARQALSDKKYKEALGGAMAALRVMPNDAGAKQLFDDANKAFNDAKKEYDRLVVAANNAVTAKRFEEAQRLYAKALDVVPGDPAVQKAQQDLQNLIADLQAGQAAFDRFMANGTQAMNQNRYADAVASFTEALRVVPTDPNAQKGLADAQTALANAQLQQNALAARKADYDRFMLLATTAMNKKLFNDAVAAYRDALVALPEDPLAIAGLHQAKYLRGMADGDRAITLKKFGEAARFYEEALKELPGDRAAREQLAVARYHAAMQDGTAALTAKKFADAVQFFEEAVKERPKDANAIAQLREAKYSRAMADGDAAMTAQKYDVAVAAYQDALKEKPQDPRANRGLMQAQRLKRQ
jgi:tetratricopeptide (TPR) repeat protein